MSAHQVLGPTQNMQKRHLRFYSKKSNDKEKKTGTLLAPDAQECVRLLATELQK